MNIKTGAADKQIDEGNVLVYVEGQEEPLSIPIVKENEMNVYRRSGGVAILHKDGSISVDFGGQIAVKKVTIQITNTTSQSNNLVEISKVEFVNDMENKIPEPELNIPSALQAKSRK